MSFSFNPLKAITRALDIPDKARPGILTGLEVVFPVIALGNELAAKGFDIVKAQAAPKTVSQSSLPRYYGEQQPYSFNFQAPNYQAPSYAGYDQGGYYDAFTQTPRPNYGGYDPWASSIPSPNYSTMPYPVYSPPAQGRTWEDLAGGLLPLALHFL